MTISNKDIAAILDDIGSLLEIEDASPFRVRAYKNAADTIRFFDPPLAAMVESGDDLQTIEGIGKAIAQKVEEIVRTGQLAYKDKLAAESSPGLLELLRLPGIGPKKVRQLRDALSIDSIDKLRAALGDGSLAEQPGFGEKSIERLQKSLARYDERQAGE